MSGIVITDEMKRAAVIAHLEWEHHKDHWEKVVEAALALVPHPPEGGMEAGERWRIFEAATAHGYWGIELEHAGNDDDAIMYPVKIHRDTVARIVDAHNAAISAKEGSSDV